jgi:hypothetical protein
MVANKKGKKSQPEKSKEDIKKENDVVFKVSFTRNTANISIELIGPEEYIQRMGAIVNGYIQYLDEYVYDFETEAREADHRAGQQNGTHNITSVEHAFEKLNFVQIGKMINTHKFNFKDIDIVLLAGAFIQQSSPKGEFSTADITKYLKLADIPPIKNPSHALKLNLEAGRVNQSGKHYSLTEDGIDRVIRTFSTLF